MLTLQDLELHEHWQDGIETSHCSLAEDERRHGHRRGIREGGVPWPSSAHPRTLGPALSQPKLQSPPTFLELESSVSGDF